MMRRDTTLENLLLTEPLRTKATLKYEVRTLESDLASLVPVSKNTPAPCSLEVARLCYVLANKYLDYLALMDCSFSTSFCLSLDFDECTSWIEHYHSVLRLRMQLSQVTAEAEIKVLLDLASLYFYINQSYLERPNSSANSNQAKEEPLYQLFSSGDLKYWFLGLVNYWNQQPKKINVVYSFQKWSCEEQKFALDFFASAECIHLINALFFYKLAPEQLEENIHPEKMISVQQKLETLHSGLLELRKQLFKDLTQDIEPGVDFLCTSKELLPPGIKFEIASPYISLIHEALKLFKGNIQFSVSKINNISAISNFTKAYSFGFNPGLVVDTVMLLRQSYTIDDDSLFEQEIRALLQQSSTMECLNLYGYFANKDTCYFLHTFVLVLSESHVVNWLPVLNTGQRELIKKCYSSLKLIMENLRGQLNSRAIHPDPYQYLPSTKKIIIRQRNQLAILRMLEVYSNEKPKIKRSDLEHLFLSLED